VYNTAKEISTKLSRDSENIKRRWRKMRRVALLVLILLLFSFGFSYSSEFKSGEYVLRKKTEVAVGAKFIKVPIEGGMEIKMLDQKRFKFDINTVNTSNFAVCDVEGIAKIVAENKAVFRDKLCY
jgi:3-methyladenine DNA glycosylase AlkD